MDKTILRIMSGIIQQNNRQITLIIFHNASLRVKCQIALQKAIHLAIHALIMH